MRKLDMSELNRLSADAFKTTEKLPITIVLDNVRSALNVGSAFRTSDAFAVTELILCGFTAQPPHREILKTALGSTESVAWRHFQTTETALQTLKAEGYKVYAIEQIAESISLQNFVVDKNAKYALVFGNEVDGVSEAALKHVIGAIEIPQFGTKHSLNIAVTVGIVTWELAKQFKFEQ
jgi:23S rRNA (guanosine2251-2'-O)-methyltransferase